MQNFFLFLSLVLVPILSLHWITIAFDSVSVLKTNPELYLIVPSVFAVPACVFFSNHLDKYSKVSIGFLGLTSIVSLSLCIHSYHLGLAEPEPALAKILLLLFVLLPLTSYLNFRTIFDNWTGSYGPN